VKVDLFKSKLFVMKDLFDKAMEDESIGDKYGWVAEQMKIPRDEVKIGLMGFIYSFSPRPNTPELSKRQITMLRSYCKGFLNE